MAAQIVLANCKLRIKTKAGTLENGADKVKSISLTGIREGAEGQSLLDVAGAIGTVISNPVLEVLRVDENVVSAE
ncbi:DUF1659 domain-containing protein [Pyramidobacter piscolens]|uniref:DUF1659 domain-containing protein n=1 Tax=Pyramidobacter piscolens W5455 TaxID=352165 RepID=A0ABM9ZW27_9BACT|nr:DUF1659 domain-containing protein [Pyramidobacter piscolens]EFB91060.1 hypothetical protein HMPREF7215_0652 [Pyramidobacter piscolens W5455]BDF78068.1 hypothetical protein CE91St28_08620 [Pyramidobacter piscolens]